jgi:hypothetical protein
MAGVVIIVIAMLIVLPVAVMLAGAIWTAVIGSSLVDDAAVRAEEAPKR